MTGLVKFIDLLPLNQISYVTGRIARWRWPRAILRPLLWAYCRAYGVCVEECGRPLSDYESFQEFFTRELKPGLRPVGEGLVSPVDGRIDQSGHVENGLLLQVKGKSYTLSDLLVDGELVHMFDGGWYCTIYLAPGDYHHIHAPVSGRIVSSVIIPGRLWPVNPWSVKNVEKVFCQNERIVTVIESGELRVGIIMVGATNVGSVTLSYDNVVTNCKFFQKTKMQKRSYRDISAKKADKLGTFCLGSTVILLVSGPDFRPRMDLGGKVLLGQSLADIINR